MCGVLEIYTNIYMYIYLYIRKSAAVSERSAREQRPKHCGLLVECRCLNDGCGDVSVG